MNQILDYKRREHDRYLRELTEYLAVPSISSDPEHNADTARCAELTAQFLADAGMVNVAVHSTAGHPIVTANSAPRAGLPAALVYGHYDVQPVDPLDLWDKDPFEAHVRNDRIVARGAADDKGQVFMHIKAAEAIRRVAGELPINLKFIIEGEEEIASPNLASFLRDNMKSLSADVVVVSDTQMLGPGMPSITYGLRGLAYLEVELTGPSHDLHSGEYGGAVANPAEILARIIAQVKDDRGKVQIPGFYDRVRALDSAERELLQQIPYDEDHYKSELGVTELWGEAGYSTHERTWIRPTFEVNGISGGFSGVGAKTVLPSKAIAKISTRLVPDQDPDEIADLVEAFIRDSAPPSVQVKIKRFHSGRAFVVPLGNPYMKAASSALKDAFQAEPFFQRGGGSIPIVADFKSILGLDTLLVGFCLPDCRAHSPNENMHLPSFFTGIEAIIRLYYKLAEV